MLRYHSWRCSGIIWGAGAQTRVRYVQGQCAPAELSPTLELPRAFSGDGFCSHVASWLLLQAASVFLARRCSIYVVVEGTVLAGLSK